MSGPKAWMFTAEGQALMRSFELAFASIEALEQQWTASLARVEEAVAEFGADRIHVSMARPSVLPQTRKVTLAHANRHLLALRAAVERVDAEVEREIRRNRRARENAAVETAAVRDRAGGIVADLMADMVRSAPPKSAPKAQEGAGAVERAASTPREPAGDDALEPRGAVAAEEPTTVAPQAADLERVLGRLALEVPAAVRAEILVLAERRAEDAFAIEARLADVRRRVQEANQAARSWPGEEEALHLLLLQVRAFQGEAAEAWARVLEAALADRTPLVADRRAEVEAFVLAEAEAEQRRVVQRAIEETLEGLGYEVGEAFETLFVEGGSVFVQRPSWGEYYVRWRVDDESGEANTNVVRAPGAPDASSVDRARRDREIEDAWCGDAARLSEALAGRGVNAQLLRAAPAGALPVPVLKQSPAGVASARAVRSRSPAARERRR